MVIKYIPDKGDICWASLDPAFGHEQKGRRPVLVLSPANYNKISELALVCPLTSKAKDYPFEVKIGKRGVVLADHLKSLSWKERRFKFIIKLPPENFLEVLNKIRLLLDI